MKSLLDRIVDDPDAPGMSVLYPTGERTPATYYRERSHGTARIMRLTQQAGRYWIGDFVTPFITVQEPVPVTHLQTYDGDGWRTWMVDEPAHWVMLHAIANRIKGPRVCIAGLGLGLILHILADRKDIDRIVVVERDRNVVELMLGNLPVARHCRINIWDGDFWEWVQTVEPNHYDTFFIDLWRGPVTEHVYDVLAKDKVMAYLHPKTNALFFCFQDAVDRSRHFAANAI